MSKHVFIALQANDDTRPIVEAIEKDNPHASIEYMPALVKINALGCLEIRKETVEEMANSNMRCDSFKSLMIINKLSKFL
ncbi:MmoB/DmpM family protein [Acinetobacter junii]